MSISEQRRKQLDKAALNSALLILNNPQIGDVDLLSDLEEVSEENEEYRHDDPEQQRELSYMRQQLTILLRKARESILQ